MKTWEVVYTDMGKQSALIEAETEKDALKEFKKKYGFDADYAEETDSEEQE